MIETLSFQPELKEAVDSRPYVVSGDIKILLSRWAEQSGFKLPSDEFFKKIRDDFGLFMTQVFPGFEFVTEEVLREGLNSLVKKDGLYPLSLDRVYCLSDLCIDIARQVDINGNDKGLGRRANSPYLLEQFRKLKASGVKEVSIIDDVVFSGDVIVRLGKALNMAGMRVKTIYAGIGIMEGINLIKGSGYEVECVRTYDSVIDEICERDFYPGVPLSGRLIDPENNIGAPYILPFGNPNKWASIPEKWQVPFSIFCMSQTIKLFEEIEKMSQKTVTCLDVGRKVINLPNDKTGFIDALNKSLYYLLTNY